MVTLVSRLLLDPAAAIGDYLDLRLVRRLWERYRRRPDSRTGRQVWRLLNFGVWHDLHWPRGRQSDIAGERATATG